jgi:hypothetical protein
VTGETLLDVLERALFLGRAAPLATVDAETLLSLAEDATVTSFAAGDTIGADGAAYVLEGRVVSGGETLRAGEATRAMRIEADRWLDVLAEVTP